jgi:hypothetical protein
VRPGVVYRPHIVAQSPLRSYALVVTAYAAVAVAYSWPLPLHFTTHLTGATTGDTAVYIWNQWVFQRELLENRSPYFTDAIFSTSGNANLALHNYSIFQNLLALPLSQVLGVIPTFNLVMLFTRVLTAFSMFLLARHVTGRFAESWLAGLVFAWSPALVTRSMAHLSLMAAAPLAVFLLALLLCAERQRWGWREAMALGLAVCWAALTDAYYGIYCLLLGALFLLTRAVRMSRTVDPVRNVRVALEVLIGATTILVAAVAISGGWQFAVFDQPVSIQSLYTPVLLLTVLVGARVGWHYRVTLSAARTDVMRSLRVVLGTGVATAVLLSPLLYAVVRRVMQSGMDNDITPWRSSPRGVDLLALLLPNPNHPLAPDQLHDWLARPTPDAYFENVASVPIVGICFIAVAWALGWRPSRWWMLVTCVFGLLALGPFVHVAGVNTFVPGPWALLRYVPVIGLARTPARFSIVLMLGVAVLLATALVWMTARWPHRRRLIVAAASVLLLLELLPAPNALHSGQIPHIYSHVMASPPDTRVLELPFGVRDGTASEGDFNAQTQYFQTAHGRRLIGGYLSRVSQERRRAIRSEPVLDALMTLSENRRLAPEPFERLVRDAPEFLRRARVGFVVVDRSRLPEALDALPMGAMGLRLVDKDGPFELYRPDPAW